MEFVSSAPEQSSATCLMRCDRWRSCGMSSHAVTGRRSAFMEVGARMLRISSRSAMAIVGLSTILAMSGLWNCRQYQVIEGLRSRERAAQEAEARRANAEAERAEAQRKRKAEWAAS